MWLLCLVIGLGSELAALQKVQLLASPLRTRQSPKYLIEDVANAGLSPDSLFGRRASLFVSESPTGKSRD
jgi:hypothetical protein